jgi:uncharacterized protein YycO
MITLRFSTVPGALTCQLIRWQTWCDYSHVDVVIPGVGLLGAQVDGVKIRPFNYAGPNAKVLYQQVDYLTPGEEADLYQFLKAQLGKPYDFGALLGDLLHRDWRNPNKWFCSELVAAAFEQIKRPMLNENVVDRVTPRDLMLCPYLEPQPNR